MAEARMRRIALSALAVLGAAALGILGLWALQRSLIYFPDRSVPTLGPGDTAWEVIEYDTEDGLRLNGWYLPPEARAPVVIVFNGNAGNRGDRMPLGRRLTAAGFGVLLTDYRGYGGNPGGPSADGLGRDARAAAGFVGQRSPGHPVVYFGESLGAAVAVELATSAPPDVLILRSPFTSLVEVGRVHYPWLPVGWLLKDRYPSLDRMAAIKAPTLVIAGDADGTIPLHQSRLIYEAAPDPSELLVVPGADHNDARLVAGPEVIDAAVAFASR